MRYNARFWPNINGMTISDTLAQQTQQHGKIQNN
jgi:hypothetical protein